MKAMYKPNELEEILLEIGFIEEMRTTWGYKEVPQTFFHNSPYLRKYDLIPLIRYYWQPSISKFCGITKNLHYKSRLQPILIYSIGLLWCHKIVKSGLPTVRIQTQLDGSLPANPVNDRRKANAVTLKSTFCLP